MKSFKRFLSNVYLSVWEHFIQTFQRRILLSFVLIAFIIVCFTSVALELAESDSRGNAIWRVIVYTMSGVDVDPPDSTLGRLIATASIFSGVLLVSLLTGYVASEFSRVVLSSQSVRFKPPSRIFEDHLVMFGWGPKRKEILRQLNSDWIKKGFDAEDIVIVSPDEYLERGTEQIYQHVWHVRGNPTDIDVLKQADLPPIRGRGAKVAVIMGQFTVSSDDNDRNSLLQLLAVEHLHPAVVSLAEVQIDTNKEHFKNANADEVFLPHEYVSMLLARTAEFHGIASYFDELLALAPLIDDSDHRNENPISFYVCNAKDIKVSGKLISDAILDFYSRTNSIIIGKISAKAVVLFPDLMSEAVIPIRDEDYLVLIARPTEL